jgi:5-methylcytosine-specific restriction endonuclease McrA
VWAPSDAIGEIDLDLLLKKNKVFRDAVIGPYFSPQNCILCEKKSENGLLLSDKKSFVCKECFSWLETVKLPEKYQAALEEYVLKSLYLEDIKAAYEKTKPPAPECSYEGTSCLGVILGFFFPPAFLATILFGSISLNKKSAADFAFKAWTESREKAIVENSPIKPELKGFFDPDAILTEKDLKIIQIFECWPGYPPFWNELRQRVFEKFGRKCAVLGCPSRCEIHVHHKKAISEGGKHCIDNLFPLCAFHHALEGANSHELIFENIRNDFFEFVKEHVRDGSTVKAHLRRRSLATQKEIKNLIKQENLCCSKCHKKDLLVKTGDTNGRLVKVYCPSCESGWIFENGLPEEIGPELCNHFHIRAILCGYKYEPKVSLEDRKGRFIQKWVKHERD